MTKARDTYLAVWVPRMEEIAKADEPGSHFLYPCNRFPEWTEKNSCPIWLDSKLRRIPCPKAARKWLARREVVAWKKRKKI